MEKKEITLSIFYLSFFSFLFPTAIFILTSFFYFILIFREKKINLNFDCYFFDIFDIHNFDFFDFFDPP